MMRTMGGRIMEKKEDEKKPFNVSELFGSAGRWSAGRM